MTATAAVVLLMLLLAGLSVRHPARTILPVYAAVVPAGSVVEISLPISPPFNTFSSLLGAEVVILILAHVLIYRNGRIPTLPVSMWLIFIAWVALTVFWAIDADAALDTVLVALPLVALMVAVAILPTDDVDLDAVRLGLILSGIAVGAYATYLVVAAQPLVTLEPEGRLVIASSSRVTDPNILAASLLLPFSLSLERLVLGGTRWWGPAVWRLLGFAGVLMTITAIATTGSRGGLLAATIAFLLVLRACWKLPSARRMVRGAALAILGTVLGLYLAALAALSVSPGGRAQDLLDAMPLGRIPRTELGGSGRLEIWTTGYQLCLEHCADGSGIGTFPTAFNQVFAFSGSAESVGADRPAHSIYLELAVETGFVGITLLALALLAEWAAATSRPLASLNPSLQGALVAVLVANLFLSTIWFKYFWLVPILIRVAEGVIQETPRPARRSRDLTVAAAGPAAD